MRRFLSDYGMILGLLALCVYFSIATITVQYPEASEAAEQVTRKVLSRRPVDGVVIVVGQKNDDGEEFVAETVKVLKAGGMTKVEQIVGVARDLRKILDQKRDAGQKVAAIATTKWVSQWRLIELLPRKYSGMGHIDVIIPEGSSRSNFLQIGNLRNVVTRNIVIAIIAIGMTMVIITGGIDLSVGSLIALSAMTTTYCVVELAGAWSAGVWSIVICMFAGIAACGLVGLLNGLMVTRFAIPPFVVTLAMMLVARGLAFIIGQGQLFYQLPDSILWLGQGADLFGIPNTIVLLLVLYIATHIMMSHTVLGRYIYAAGGNTEAARLSGVPVKRVILFCYVMCGALAGLGGVIRTSILKSGSPRYGEMSELYVIAAVVVGGTSLGGGKGKIFGTLIGVLIISVIQNGMNLTDVESYTQKVVLGLVILGAVLLDSLRGGKGFKGLAKLLGLKRSQPKST
ncbi:MAG: ABC transporter permease [Phycisphaerae bacterium]|nr:ABC transporter permease [Phycisphaerae bacterium]